MPDDAALAERTRLSRLRWRLRGAWMWPAFAVLTVADGLILHWLPFGGDGWDVVPCLIVAGFANLFLVAVAAPAAGFLYRRRRRSDLPQMIAADYAGTALLLALSLGFVAGGVIHRPLIDDKNRARDAELAAAQAYFVTSAPAAYGRHATGIDTLKLEKDYYRTCMPTGDPERAMCVFVSTDTSPPGIRADPSRETNTSFAGRFGAYRAR
jgi:hypothetical protein